MCGECVESAVCSCNCTYPLMIDSTAMYANLPLPYCESCKHHKPK